MYVCVCVCVHMCGPIVIDDSDPEIREGESRMYDDDDIDYGCVCSCGSTVVCVTLYILVFVYTHFLEKILL